LAVTTAALGNVDPVMNVAARDTDGTTFTVAEGATDVVVVVVVVAVGALRQRNPLTAVCLHINGTGSETTCPTFEHTPPGAGCGLAPTTPPALGNITPNANTAATTTRFKRLITLSYPGNQTRGVGGIPHKLIAPKGNAVVTC
jgi:hypothetical protein